MDRQRRSPSARHSLRLTRTNYNNKLPYNDFIYYNKVQNNVTGSTSTLTGGYDREHRISYTLVLGFPYDIQLSSIGTFQSGFYYPLSYTVDPRVASRQLGRVAVEQDGGLPSGEGRSSSTTSAGGLCRREECVQLGEHHRL